MRIFVAGGRGMVGSRLVTALRAGRHDVVVGSRAAGVDVLTGQGLGDALVGVDVVVDALNTPDLDPEAATAFFRATTRRLLAAEESTGVGHHVLLSVVGADRAPGNGHLVGKVAAEDAIRDGDVPFSIVRATRFGEFVPTIADRLTVDGVVLAPRTVLRPVAVDDVVDLLVTTATGAPTGGTTDLAGPEAFALDDLLRRVLPDDPREIRTVQGQALGAESVDALVPLGEFRSSSRTIARWTSSPAHSSSPAAS